MSRTVFQPGRHSIQMPITSIGGKATILNEIKLPSILWISSTSLNSVMPGTTVTEQINKGVHRRNTKTPKLMPSGALCVRMRSASMLWV